MGVVAIVYLTGAHVREPGLAETAAALGLMIYAAAARGIEARVRSESALPSPTEERLRFIQFRLEQATSRSLVARLSRAC